MTLPRAPDRWAINLTNTERVEAIAAFGFTERQARFLLNVLLHSGVFVERQYCSFAGIVHGQKSTDFLKTLVERRFATPISTGIVADAVDREEGRVECVELSRQYLHLSPLVDVA